MSRQSRAGRLAQKPRTKNGVPIEPAMCFPSEPRTPAPTIAQLSHSLSQHLHVEVLLELAKGPSCAAAIAASLGRSVAAAYSALDALRRLGLVTKGRCSNKRQYALSGTIRVAQRGSTLRVRLLATDAAELEVVIAGPLRHEPASLETF